MSENILKLAERQAPEVDQGLVQRIEDILAMAKSGELQSFWGVGSTVTGDMLTTMGPTPNIWADIGCLEIIKTRMIEDYC